MQCNTVIAYTASVRPGITHASAVVLIYSRLLIFAILLTDRVVPFVLCRDPQGAQITQRSKEQAIEILNGLRQQIVDKKANFADLAKVKIAKR